MPETWKGSPGIFQFPLLHAAKAALHPCRIDPQNHENLKPRLVLHVNLFGKHGLPPKQLPAPKQLVFFGCAG